MSALRDEEWADRLSALRGRGLSVEVSGALLGSRDEGSLLQLELQASDEDLVELSRLWAADHGRRSDETGDV